ncbi:hypothetical protein Agub_g6557 [Astrephomene gubernaculifera]|uniref:Uncharacterized protein n=1 Tax=Astrephomene gubernaculifera TaxID=47775 RepID=A0AAD3HLN7_9CHLO|nr:hypothetical protein Agub_g6557 [Astrephomene gubernaculifera]
MTALNGQRCLASTSRQLILSVAVALGLLCRHSVALSLSNAGQDVWGGDKLFNRWREVLSARVGKGEPAPSVFEQAFTATYTSNDPGEVQRTLEQYALLVRWLESTPHPNATHLALVPEFGDANALAIASAAVSLSKQSSKDAAGMVQALSSISDKLSAATPWRGYAATRRALVGALLKRRIDFGGRFPAEVQSAVDGIMLKLFQLHKNSSANRGAVQFFHVSKSGGTNLCQAAEANGCATQGFDTRTNCLIRDFIDQPRWVTYNAHKYVQYRMSSRQALPWFVNFHTFRPVISCEQRRAYLLQNNFTFYANEYTNPPGANVSSEMCEDFVNLIMFRHPYERLRSQIGWVQKLYKEFYLDVDTQRAFINRTTGFWERLMPAGVNNYYIRSLLGQRFFEFPVMQVAPEHIGLAQLASLQHDILLILESKTRNELAMRVGLGWSQALRDGAVRSSTELGDAVALPLDYDTMLERNLPDVEVYAFAREMQALDTLLWNFVVIADEQLGFDNLSSEQCGYVSMGSAKAVEERAERLSGVTVPVMALRPNAAAAAAAAAAAGEVPPSSISGTEVVDEEEEDEGESKGEKGADGNTGGESAAGKSSSMGVLRGGVVSKGGRGSSIISISRHRRSRRVLAWR